MKRIGRHKAVPSFPRLAPLSWKTEGVTWLSENLTFSRGFQPSESQASSRSDRVAFIRSSVQEIWGQIRPCKAPLLPTEVAAKMTLHTKETFKSDVPAWGYSHFISAIYPCVEIQGTRAGPSHRPLPPNLPPLSPLSPAGAGDESRRQLGSSILALPTSAETSYQFSLFTKQNNRTSSHLELKSLMLSSLTPILSDPEFVF